MQLPSHHRGKNREPGADHEWNPPAPFLQLLRRQKDFLQQQQHDDRGELPADQGDVLKARIETAVAGVGHLAQVGRAGAVFAAEAQSFDDSCQRQNRRRGEADRGIGRRNRDDQ